MAGEVPVLQCHESSRVRRGEASQSSDLVSVQFTVCMSKLLLLSVLFHGSLDIFTGGVHNYCVSV